MVTRKGLAFFLSHYLTGWDESKVWRSIEAGSDQSTIPVPKYPGTLFIKVEWSQKDRWPRN